MKEDCQHLQQIVKTDKKGISTQICAFCKVLIARWVQRTGQALFDFMKE